MKHAFIITAYKDAQQLLLLVQKLCSHDHYIFITVDGKSELERDPIINKIEVMENVHLFRGVSIHWGGYSHLWTLLKMLYVAIRNPETTYFHTMSGQCFPTISPHLFTQFFISNSGKEYISCMELPCTAWANGGLDRLQYFHLNDIFDPSGKLFKRINPVFLHLQACMGIKRSLPGYFNRFYGGGTWWSLSRKAIEYILSVIDTHSDLLNRLKNTFCPEEILFQTILMNSQFKDRIVNDDLRYIDWSFRHGSCPAVLDETDYRKIYGSNKIIARKFSTIESRKLISMLINNMKNNSE